MSVCQVRNVHVLDNPSTFDKPLQFEITFECIKNLAEGEPNKRKNML